MELGTSTIYRRGTTYNSECVQCPVNFECCYSLPNDFTGWETMSHRAAGHPRLPRGTSSTQSASADPRSRGPSDSGRRCSQCSQQYCHLPWRMCFHCAPMKTPEGRPVPGVGEVSKHLRLHCRSRLGCLPHRYPHLRQWSARHRPRGWGKTTVWNRSDKEWGFKKPYLTIWQTTLLLPWEMSFSLLLVPATRSIS